jgi:hypothetical protein
MICNHLQTKTLNWREDLGLIQDIRIRQHPRSVAWEGNRSQKAA